MSVQPLFNKLKQVAMVVRDAEATARRYWEDLGIGPWRFYTLDPSNTLHMVRRGEPAPHAFRVALTSIGDVQIELIEPLDDNNLYAEHLCKHGESLHHLSFQVASFEQAKTRLEEKGYAEIQGGQPFGICQYAYFDTQDRLACIAEIGSDVREGESFPAPQFSVP